MAELADVGVRRVSVGGGFAFAALGALVEAATELLEDGTYSFWERASVGSQCTLGLRNHRPMVAAGERVTSTGAGLRRPVGRPAARRSSTHRLGGHARAGRGRGRRRWVGEAGGDLATVADVRHAERLLGDPDDPIRVAVAAIARLQDLRDEQLAALPGVQRLTSTIVLKRIVEERPFPVSPHSPRPQPKRQPCEKPTDDHLAASPARAG